MPTDLNGTPTSLGIGTYNVDSDAPSGLGFNEAMAQIDALIAGRIAKSLGTAAGDLVYFTGSAAPARLAVGSSGQILTVAGGLPVWQDPASPSGTPTGVVLPYAGASAPTGWTLADGTARKRSGADPGDSQDYSALFALIATLYGAGDGSTTFNVPDLRGRTAVGKGSNATVSTLGNNDGVSEANRRGTKHRHTPHTHTLNGLNNDASFTAGSGVAHQSATNAFGTLSADGGSGVGTDPLDGGAYLVLNHIIKL